MNGASEAWSLEQEDLWARIERHPFDDPTVSLDFARRLARTLDWQIETAREAINEYRRFCFLCVVSSDPVTPSEEVDEVWHLHLTYSRDYWDRWCSQVLRCQLHHDPTEGGTLEQCRYRAQYAETLALYERWFGPPPLQFWPGTNERFASSQRYYVVDRRRSWIMPIPRWSALLGIAG